jgi:hypothetical protein
MAIFFLFLSFFLVSYFILLQIKYKNLDLFFWSLAMIMVYYIFPGVAEIYLNSIGEGLIYERVSNTSLVISSIFIFISSFFFIIFYYLLNFLFPIKKNYDLDYEGYWKNFFSLRLIFFTIFILLSLFYIVDLKSKLGFTHYLGNLSVVERSLNSTNYKLNYLKTFLYFFFPLGILILLNIRNYFFTKILILSLLITITFQTSYGGAAGFIGPLFYFISFYYYYPFSKIKLSKTFFYLIIIILLAYALKDLSRSFIITGSLNFEFYRIFKGLYQNIHGFQSLSLIIENPERGICSYCNFFDVFLPRFLFPSKGNDLTLGIFFTNSYWFDYIQNFVDQATSITLFGESYMNLGMFGFLISFIFAFVIYLMNKIFYLSRKSPVYLWYTMVMFFPSFHYIYSLSSWIAILIKDTALFFLLIIILKSLRIIKKNQWNVK